MRNAPLALRSALAALAVLVSLANASVATVSQPADPPARRTAALEEVWRLGGDNEADPLMGFITAGARDADGNVYLVDNQLSQVLAIGPDGDFLGTLGREGDGPGEMRQPHSLVLVPGAVGVVQGFPAKIVFLDRAGTPAGEASLGGGDAAGGFRFVRSVTAIGDRLVGAIGHGSFDMEKGTSTTISTLSVMDREGAVLASFAEHEQEQNFQKFEFDERKNWAEFDAWCVTPDGRVCSTGERDRWLVNVRNLDGELVETWERPFAPRRRTAEDKEKIGSDMRMVVNGRRVEQEVHALDTDAAIAGMHASADGRVFVITCHDTRERLEQGTAGRFTVVGKDGALVEELTLTFPGFDPQHDALSWLDGTHFLVLRNIVDAQRARQDADAEAPEDLGDAEPVEVVLVRLAG